MSGYVKVLLPGERPWIEFLDRSQDRIKGRITNKLWPEFSEHEQAQVMNRDFGTVEKLPVLHNYKKGDELWFEQGTGNREGWWVPMKKPPANQRQRTIHAGVR